jgi:hypothetical protein
MSNDFDRRGGGIAEMHVSILETSSKPRAGPDSIEIEGMRDGEVWNKREDGNIVGGSGLGSLSSYPSACQVRAGIGAHGLGRRDIAGIVPCQRSTVLERRRVDVERGGRFDFATLSRDRHRRTADVRLGNRTIRLKQRKGAGDRVA